MPAAVDVVVVGGGVIGLSIAFDLARNGFGVCLLERGDIGAGTSSAAAAAALLQTKSSPLQISLTLQSLALLDELDGVLDEELEYERSGSLLVATSLDDLALVEDRASVLASHGVQVELVDGDRARLIAPVLGPSTMGASFSPRDATINPLRLLTAYAGGAGRAGALISTFTEVIGIRTSGDRIRAVKTSKGWIETDAVVNAAGVWAPSLAAMIGAELPVTPLKGEILVTEPLPRLLDGTIISVDYMRGKSLHESGNGQPSSGGFAGITLTQVARGNVIIGSTRERAGFDRGSTPEAITVQARRAVEMAPSLSGARIIRAYAGLRPVTPDGLPIVGSMPGLEGFVVATGFGGDGLALSAVVPSLVRRHLEGASMTDEMAAMSPARFGSTLEGRS